MTGLSAFAGIDPVALSLFIFIASGLALLFLLYRKAGERDRRLRTRLAGLLAQGEESAGGALPAVITTPLYLEREEGKDRRKGMRRKAVPLILILLIALGGAIPAFQTAPTLTSSFLLALAGLAGGVFLVQRYRKKRRQQRFTEQLPEAIDIIIRGARVGMSLQENFQVIGAEMPDPLGGLFRILSEKLSIGIDLETALDAAVKEIGVKELQFMATTLILQRRTGGQYAEVLENLARVLRDRRAQYLKARALTSEARTSARIVTGVTGVILLILAATNRAQFDFLFDDPLGQNLLIYSVASILIGFFIMSRLLRRLR